MRNICSKFLLFSAAALLFLMSLVASVHAQLADVTQPGDPIVGSSNNNPGSEGVANAIDNQPTKYLNFDANNNALPTGFTVTPRVGLSVVQYLTLTSANDAPERDPASYTLEGSYDGTNFTMIAGGSVPTFTNRFTKVIINFNNITPYLSYRLMFPTVVNAPSTANSMQISEVELLGFLAPTDVTQPGDPIVGSSNNNPGSEGVANAIDNQPTKYLNFDANNNALPTGFTVTPTVGATLVSGMTLTSANDAPERDPATYVLEGSLDGISFFPIAAGNVPAFPSRFSKKYIFFSNSRAYQAYRLTFPTVVNAPSTANSMQISEVELLGVVSDLPQDITQPGDPIVGSSNNNPGSEGVANAIDNQPTKYLNFDANNNALPTGFTVSPRSGLTRVSGLTLTSANDAPERDPATYTLEGSYNGSNFTAIASGNVPAFTNRFHKVTILFSNSIPYLQYRLMFPTVVNAPSTANSMQISEVELLGVLAPSDVTVPGDPIVGSSNNNPGSEGVANAIDNQPTKYLNFDANNNALPTGFTVTPGVGDTIVIGLTLTSANDAPERDPATYTLEGSNDGANYVPISSGSVPAFPSRFYKNYIFFSDNTKSFKSYRLMFPTVVNAPSTANSMQISEVEFLGVTPGVINTNPVDNLIRTQPRDTPVLLGSAATFRVGLTGPWKVQWYKNGVAIPGANNAAYTTPVATAGDDGALFQALVQSSSGQQRSDEVMLSIFTPSVTESIGLSWRGSGANGAPTDMLPTDITGFQPQAYWNNLGPSSTLASPLNSSNQANATITITWATSGEWGVGTGNSDPTERMLNGIATSRSTTEASAQTVTFSGVPSGTHSLFVYTVQVPQEFANMDFAVVTHDSGGGDVVQRRYIRPQNSDEYNPSPGFSLVTAETPADRGVGNMMRFDNLHPGADGIIQVRFFVPGRLGAQGPGVNGMQLVLNPPPAGAPPIITRQPVSANGIVGGQITLVAEATGPGLGYQWLKNGQTIAGATGPQYTLATLQTNDSGNYTVVVSNPAGRVASRTAVVGVVASAQLTFGVRSYFKFDDADGTVATNSATGGLNGTVVGNFPTHEAGQLGTALTFVPTDGTYVVVPNYPKVSQAMTVAGWVYSPSGQWGPLINNWVEGRTTGQSGQFMMDVIFDTAGALIVRGQIEVGPNRVLASAALDAEQSDNFIWHHFAMSANGITLSIYWDGRLVSSVDYLGSINAIAALPWLSLGANLTADTVPVPNPALTPNLWSGALDDVALWGRSLSDIEVLGIYRYGQGGTNLANSPPVLNTNINAFPVAANDTATTPRATAVTINVLANDSDPNGDTLTVTATTQPANGAVVINANGSVAYTPSAGFTGTNTFNYTVADGRGGIASATVTVTVTEGTTPPTATSYAGAVLADEPIAYWRFNDTGSVAVNSGSLGAAANGTYQGNAAAGSVAPRPPQLFGFEPDNTALQLDGSGDFVGTMAGLMNGRPVFTMSGWIRRNADQGDRTGLWGQNDLVEFGYINNNTLEVWTDNGLHQSPDPTTNPFPNGEWAHVAFVSEGSPGVLKLYTNGVFANERSHTLPADNTFPFNIGGGGVFDAIAANGNYFNGQIDEVAIFAKALTAEQIAAQYNAAPRSTALPYVLNIGGNKVGTVTDNGGGSFSVLAGGNDIWDQRDEFTYAYTEVSGDFDVQVRVESLQFTANWTKAGLMARESLSEYSRMAFLRVTPTNAGAANDVRLSYRTGVDNVSGVNGGQHEDPGAGFPNPNFPNAWLRLVRSGDMIHASNSVDGVAWNFVASQDTTGWGGGALPKNLYLGLATSRHSGASPTAAAEYRNFKFNYTGPFVLAGADSRGNPTGVRVTFNNPLGTGAFDPISYTLTSTSGPNVTVVAGLRFTTANDAPERDPMTFTLEGTTADPAAGDWQLIASGDTGLGTNPGRNTAGPIVPVVNGNGYRAYRLLFPTVRDAAAANSMQVSEIELLDAGGNDVTAPGDAVVGVVAVAGSSASAVAVAGTAANVNNYPAAESPNLATDNSASTKYLNFAKVNTGIIVTPAGGSAPAAATVIAVAKGPTATTVQLTTSPLVEGASYNLEVLFTVQDSTGQELTVTTTSFVHGAGYEARPIRVTHSKTDDSGYYRNSDAVAKGIGDLVALGGGVFPGVEGNSVFEDPIPDTGSNERFSTRVSGVLNITTSGNYTFYMSSDDVGFLYLSTNDDPAKKVQIANEPAWNGRREYIAGGNQASRGVPPANISAPIALQAGGLYYLELIFTEGGGGNNGSATWVPPGGVAPTNGSSPIPDSAFKPSRVSPGGVFTRLGPVQIVSQPQDALVPEGMSATFTVRADGTPNYTYQWRKNGVNIAGATDRSYTTPPFALADEGAAFSVVVANEFSSATSASGILRGAGVDQTPPRLLRAGGSGVPATAFSLVYSEPVNKTDAETLGNYSVSGGVTLSSATLQADNVTVNFVSSALNTAGGSILTVNNVRDRAGTPNVIAANSQVNIAYAEGRIRYFQFDNAGSGVALADLFSNPNFPNFPDRAEYRTSMEAPDSDGGNNFQNYGGQLQGYLTAPVTGDYIFYIAADDQGALYLSTDSDPAHKVEIAREPIWSVFRTYIGGGGGGGGRVCPGPNCNISAPITLQAGQKYYIEGLLKEGGGGDYISVAWQTPASGPQPNPVVNGMAPIPGAFLSPYDQPATVAAGTPADIATAEGLDATFTAGISASAPLNVTWYRSGVEVPGQTHSSLSLTNVQLADSGATFFVVVSNSLNVVTSRVATLTVTNAPAPRVLAAQGGAFFEKVTVFYDQPMDATTAVDPFNYDISDGTASLVFSAPVLSADGRSVTLPLDPTSLLREDTLYTVTVQNVESRARIVVDPAHDTATFRSAVFSCGFLTFETFNGSAGPLNAGLIAGNMVANLTGHPSYPNSPSETFFLPGFDTRLNPLYANDSHEQYGGRIRGLFVPPTSGNWIFHFRADDGAQLLLNPAGPSAVGAVEIQAQAECCANFTANVSAPQALTAGQHYYIEALYKEGGGGDYCAVAARLDTDTTPVGSLQPIPASQLGLYADPTGAIINITQQPTDQLFLISTGGTSTVTFTVGANASLPGNTNQAIFYSWQRDNGAGFVSVPSGGSTLTLAPTAADNGARFRAVLYIPGAVRTTDVATLTVAQPNTPPQFVCGPSQIVTQDFGAQVVPNWATGISPHSIVRSAITYSADFSALPAGATLVGGKTDGPSIGSGVISNGVLRLTVAENSGWGVFYTPPLPAAIESYTISLTAYVGGGTCCGDPLTGGPTTAADGFSINVANDLPAVPAYGNPGEEGAGNGVTVQFDTWDNGGGEAPACEVEYASTSLARVPLNTPHISQGAGVPRFIPIRVAVHANGTLDVDYDGTNVLTGVVLTGYAPQAGLRLGLGARTGGANDNHWIDNLQIEAFSPDASAAEAGQTVSFLVSNDHPEYFSVQPAVASNGTLTYTPAPGRCGLAKVTIVAKDNGGTANGGIDTSAPCTIDLNIICVGPPNTAPTAQSQSVTTGLNAPVTIALVGTDADGDALTYTIGSAPAHGTLSGSGATRVYTPNTGYAGPDSFTFTVNDGQLSSAPATVSITVLPNPNRTPTALNQSVTTLQDTPVNITLVGTDPDGDALSYIVVGSPLHGTLSGSGATRTYTPTAGYSGADAFTFKVNDGMADSGVATVSITVNQSTPNRNPIAKITGSPLVDFSPSLVDKAIIAGCGDEHACVTLDARLSSDPDGDNLTFSWFLEPAPAPFAMGAVVTNCLEFGRQTILLSASDGKGGIGTDTLTIEVLNTDEALGLLIDKVNTASIARKNKRPFIATLKAATASIARGQCSTAANQLKAFQNKVRAQVSRDNPSEAEIWTRWAQYVIDALNR